jgi:hypothetical protein
VQFSQPSSIITSKAERREVQLRGAVTFKRLSNEMEVTDVVRVLLCSINKTTGPSSSLRDTPTIEELGYELPTLRV